MCKSTSYNLEVGRQGPTWRKGSKGGVSGPAEDLRPVSEVEAGVNFRPAVGVLPGKQPAQVPGGYGEVRSHLPSTRRFLTPDSRHLDGVGHQAIHVLDEGV